MRCNQWLVTRSDQPENRYGLFARDILVAEGLTGFGAVDLAAEPLPDLGAGDLALVTRCVLTRAQCRALLDSATAGAGVVVLQPQQGLAEEIGLRPEYRVLNPGYIQIRDGYPGSGAPIQAHLPVPRYAVPEAADGLDVMAEAFGADWAGAGWPAVVKARVGKGWIVLFLYDLAEAVARIRFGNPDLAGYATNGRFSWPHTFDLFVDHLDPRVAHLPQADFHGQLLARALTDVAPQPLARLWYYPEAGQRTAGVFQSDGDMSTPEQFESLAAALERRGGTATFYLMEDTRLSEATVAALRARGHTFAPHVNPRERDEELEFAMPEALADETARFRARFGACSPTLQCHCAPWAGYLSIVPAHIANGYRLLFGYIPWPVEFWGKYLCGSGRPMKFFDRDGTGYDCWQQPIMVMDDATLVEKLGGSPEVAMAEFDAAFDAAVQTSHTATPILSHPVSFCTYSSRVIEHCLDRLHAEDAPIFNGDQWLAFQDRRAAVRLEQACAADGTLTIHVSGLEGRLPLMVPLAAGGAPAVCVDGAPANAGVLRRLGQEYCVVQLDGDGRDIRVEIRSDGGEGASTEQVPQARAERGA
ncbi:MAG: hypothetical protein JXR94_10505 [Candidatus Hydrogenedentes bacterium]|nr:hypothetical protein [Candidatus Hydrogenedentota bacterium]